MKDMLIDRIPRVDTRPAVIVASGPSAAGFVAPSGCMVIAVNGAIDWLRGATHWFTLDPSDANRRRWSQPKSGVRYCAAVDAQEILPEHVDRYLRVPGKRPEPRQKYSPEWWLWRWSGALGMNRCVGQINTGNSAWGALQLARKLGAKRAILVGVDASSEPRVEGGEPNNLSHLPLLFESGLETPGFEFVNCGAMRSRVPKMTIDEGIQWLMR